ncbi:hypothetical protein ACHWQZ_G017777 [Mnemiopsis leidyi]
MPDCEKCVQLENISLPLNRFKALTELTGRCRKSYDGSGSAAGPTIRNMSIYLVIETTSCDQAPGYSTPLLAPDSRQTGIYQYEKLNFDN